MNPSTKNSSTQAKTTKKHALRKIIVILLFLLATGYAVLAVANRNTDPTTWEGIRSGYKNTK